VKPAQLKLTLIFGILVLIAYFAIIIFGDNGLRALNAMKQELNSINVQNEKIQQNNIEKHRKVKRLKEDPEFIENIARQELKMIKKDEVVFKFQRKDAVESKKTNEPKTAPSTHFTDQPADINAQDKGLIQKKALPNESIAGENMRHLTKK
jgi:cell division protein FtsB